VLPTGCADPGVTFDGTRYLMTCTSGGAANAFPVYESTDLTSWTLATHIFSSATKPTWATGDFWAPEIHHVGQHWVAYFSARNTDGKLSIGAAYADAALGPYTALAQPLVHDANMGLIDASELTDTTGTPYLLWKEDGNAVGQPTPIHIQPLAADGLSLTGTRATLITNDQTWEGAVTEGPFMIEHAGSYYPDRTKNYRTVFELDALHDDAHPLATPRADPIAEPSRDRGAARAARAVLEIRAEDLVPVALDHRRAARRAERRVAVGVVDVARVDVAQAGGAGDPARALERRERRVGQVAHPVVGMERGEVERDVGAEVAGDELGELGELLVAVVERRDDVRRDLGPDLGLVDEVAERVLDRLEVSGAGVGAHA
jgi:hypothetical protein